MTNAPDRADRDRIEAALAKVARQEAVEILFAVESGSRAWGFPSSDSDWDVRFVFRRRLADYLCVSPPVDVIEREIDGSLDIAGWDLRKALSLLVRSNAAMLEWLSSPIVLPRSRLPDMARPTGLGGQGGA